MLLNYIYALNHYNHCNIFSFIIKFVSQICKKKKKI
jgi:hypothetical protein